MKSNRMIGYIYRLSEVDYDVKVTWNVGLNEWENANDLEVLDMTQKENINLFMEYYTKERKNVITTFYDYVEWAHINNGDYHDIHEFFQLGTNKYRKIEFLSFDGAKIIDSKFERVYKKVYSKGKFIIYNSNPIGFYYYDNKVYYLVDIDTNNVYFVGFSKYYDNSYKKPFKFLKEAIENYYYDLETQESVKIVDNNPNMRQGSEPSRKRIKDLTGIVDYKIFENLLDSIINKGYLIREKKSY